MQPKLDDLAGQVAGRGFPAVGNGDREMAVFRQEGRPASRVLTARRVGNRRKVVLQIEDNGIQFRGELFGGALKCFRRLHEQEQGRCPIAAAQVGEDFGNGPFGPVCRFGRHSVVRGESDDQRQSRIYLDSRHCQLLLGKRLLLTVLITARHP